MNSIRGADETTPELPFRVATTAVITLDHPGADPLLHVLTRRSS